MSADTRFRRSWWGYSRTEVDRFLRDTAAERLRLNDALARVEALMAELQDGPQAILDAAHRQAAEIRANAERDARSWAPPQAAAPVRELLPEASRAATGA